MKKIFIDANILIAVLNKEYPLYSNAARVMSLADVKGCEIYTSTICLAIAWYFAEKKSGNKLARKKIALLSNHINICSSGSQEVENAINNPSVHDFEDGIEYYTAIQAGCNIIVTENKDDFYFSSIRVCNAEELIRMIRENL